MRDDSGRCAERTIDLVDDFEDLDAGLEVERTGGLVAKQDLRLLGDGACDRDALLLAAGELRRKVIHSLAQTDQVESFPGVERVPRDLGDQCNVLAGREARHEVVELENEPDVIAPELRELVLAFCPDVAALVENLAGGRHIERAENVEQRGLPTTRRT